MIWVWKKFSDLTVDELYLALNRIFPWSPLNKLTITMDLQSVTGAILRYSLLVYYRRLMRQWIFFGLLMALNCSAFADSKCVIAIESKTAAVEIAEPSIRLEKNTSTSFDYGDNEEAEYFIYLGNDWVGSTSVVFTPSRRHLHMSVTGIHDKFRGRNLSTLAKKEVLRIYHPVKEVSANLVGDNYSPFINYRNFILNGLLRDLDRLNAFRRTNDPNLLSGYFDEWTAAGARLQVPYSDELVALKRTFNEDQLEVIHREAVRNTPFYRSLSKLGYSRISSFRASEASSAVNISLVR